MLMLLSRLGQVIWLLQAALLCGDLLLMCASRK